ncbi:MAG: DUF72 domain-containing protein [Caldilineaceae bacterium]
MTDKQPENADIARVLDRIADLLEAQDANIHRVRAYRNAASRVSNADDSIADIVRRRDGGALFKRCQILEAFLEMLPAGRRYTFEFRDITWFEEAVYEMLAAHNAAFCT